MSDRYANMQYRRTGRSGLKLPAISLGLWQNFGGNTSPELQGAIVRRAFDLGITHFDLANNYGPPPGSAEKNFGRILTTDLAGHRDDGHVRIALLCAPLADCAACLSGYGVDVLTERP